MTDMNPSQTLKILLCAIIFINISGISGAIVADRDVIIGFKQKPGLSEKTLVISHGGIAKKTFHLIPAISAKIPGSEIESIKRDPRVVYIEDDVKFKVTYEYTNSWGVQHIGSQLVHNNSFNGTGVKIAVLDTGIDYNHQDLRNNYKGGVSFVGYTTDPWDDDCLTEAKTCHGTHVSGIIAAEKNNIGVVGVAPNASIYAVKVLSPIGGDVSWIISGLQWAVDNNMDIATMSLGGPDTISLRLAVDNAYNSGLLLVASAGNTGGYVEYPAAYESVIAVSSTDANDQLASDSSRGPKIELAAPGVDIYSTKNDGGYGYLSGTSMAAPHVTGVAALIFGNLSDLNGDGFKNNIDVRLTLQNTAKDLGITGRDDIYGFGLVDASNAVLGIPYHISTPPEEPIKLTIVRTKGPETKDAKNVSLSSEGNYSIEIRNINLSKLAMTVYDNGTKRDDLSSVYKFNKTNNITVNRSVGVGSVFKFVFTPYGDKNTISYVTIRRIQ
jgi:subtilisin